ncbi:aminodeoxychorismate synthase component I [Amycolatopsis sacchari]|uniref:aminodeoxychorismate synthase component I n=1 Tax=Amycolatopsis sacchari TaxID=115433 RepID=UPI003D7592AB
MRPQVAFARFDDLRAGTAMAFPEIAYDLVAHRPEDVVGVLAELDRATADGWWAFGYVAYEAASGLDPALPVHDPVPGLPLAWFGVCAAPESVPVVTPPEPGAYRVGEWTPQWTEEEHRRRVEAVRRHIAAGETYQCNLTTRLTAGLSGDLAACYADLALAQRGSYSAYLDLGRFVIAGASPELFFEIRDGDVHLRPMKGTARRGGTPEEDAAIVARLRASTKERAENIMIVDLMRNDVARVAETGSVRVTSLCHAEQYETVHQLTSDVSARLLPGTGTAEVFRALFPCGSVTGAPKPRTMALIRDLEPGPRGVYCGAVGVVAPEGAPFRARFNVAIRTVLADRDTGLATYGTGGGITWGSEPAAEYAELLAKAEVLTARPRIPG